MLASKYLSYILRHHPEDANLTLDSEGWCDVKQLLTNLKISQEELDETVYNNTRFIYNADKSKIKAAHGHSVKIEYHNEKVPPMILYHGTAIRFKDAIMKEGLKKMTREAVHMSDDYKDAQTVGSRHSGGSLSLTIVFKINANQMYKDGYKFYKSEDGVWLTDNVPPKYLSI